MRTLARAFRNGPPVTLAIEESERRIVHALREIPASSLRDEVVALVEELLNFVAEPSCHQAQADGVPCPTALSSCETCRRVVSVLEDMSTRLHTD